MVPLTCSSLHFSSYRMIFSSRSLILITNISLVTSLTLSSAPPAPPPDSLLFFPLFPPPLFFPFLPPPFFFTIVALDVQLVIMMGCCVWDQYTVLNKNNFQVDSRHTPHQRRYWPNDNWGLSHYSPP